ncbi:quinolinate synthase NadA [Syntrophus aciditrophicus]|uniref:Quinolinate synthase n=1 Tax=Syntrophus aciditrophicus (strain SB) TaxID=56780 RepID=Q2LRR2_SYNAS|nr:quinolinate synthase NadA [Syntrophus aciditrophicus]ABC76775.1 quinolinate synthetase A [Syntrophus aciditrophicus SB]
MSLSDLQSEIRALLHERNAILLAHYYQREEVQEIADILGDSLALSIEAARTNADVIVFAGVHFMAESASIISPDKTVLLPHLGAGCPLADKITPVSLAEARKKYPDAAVVTYINSSAEIKAHSDICCTSANAVKVVNSLTDARQILMIPDGNLARYTARFTDKEIIPWEGYCPFHHFVLPEEVARAKAEHPGALFIAHPECNEAVVAMADFVGSTSAMIEFCRKTDVREIIVGTEIGIMTPLKKQNPEKIFISPSESLVCQTMKLITLENILASLKTMTPVIKVPEAIRIPAKRALDRMLAVR